MINESPTKINEALQVIKMIVLVNNAHEICQINKLNIKKYNENIRFSHHSLCLGIFVFFPVGAGWALTPAACFCVVSVCVPLVVTGIAGLQQLQGLLWWGMISETDCLCLLEWGVSPSQSSQCWVSGTVEEGFSLLSLQAASVNQEPALGSTRSFLH